MILGQISYLDCLAFLVFLAPQLLLHINIIELIICILKALPFIRKQSVIQNSQELNLENGQSSNYPTSFFVSGTSLVNMKDLLSSSKPPCFKTW